MSKPRKEKCIWCAGDGGALTTVEVPVDTEIPAGESRLEEVAVHPRHRSEARDYCFAAARYVKRDFFIVLGMPVLVVAAIGGLKRGRQIVRLGGVAWTLFGLAVLALAFA